MFKLLLTGCYVLFGFCCFAQSDSRTNFDKAVDYLNCKMVENSLISANSGYINEFNDKCPCNDQPTYDKLKSFIDTGVGLSTTSYLSDEVDEIKKEFYNIQSNRRFEFLTASVFEDRRFQKIARFKTLRINNNREFDNFIFSISPNLKSILDNGVINGEIKLPSTWHENLTNKIDKLESDIEHHNHPIPLSTYILFLVSVLVSIVSSWLIAKKTVSTAVKNRNQNTNNAFEEFVTKQKIITTILRKDFNELKATINSAKSSEQESGKSEKETNYLYFPAPDNEGSFDNAAGSAKFLDGKSIYQFELHGSKDARFSIYNHPNSVGMALKFPEGRIYSVCEQINGTPPHDAHTIITEEKGIVHLIDNKWRLINKARISLDDTAVLPTQKQKEKQPQTPPPIAVAKPKFTPFYLPSPNNNGTFDNKQKHTAYKEGKSLYKFEPISETEALFSFVEEATQLAIQYPEERINVVCVSQNIFNHNATKIITISKGKALLHDTIWEVLEKNVIKYE